MPRLPMFGLFIYVSLCCSFVGEEGAAACQPAGGTSVARFAPTVKCARGAGARGCLSALADRTQGVNPKNPEINSCG